MMTQAMRARYCAEFLNRCADEGRVVAVVADRRAFADVELPSSVDVVVVISNTATLPSERVLRSSLARRVVGWMRSGSTMGWRAERLIRSIMWRLRYIDRAATVMAERRASPSSVDELTAALKSLEHEEPITELVAFDAFDLPALVAFAERRDMRVRLR